MNKIYTILLVSFLFIGTTAFSFDKKNVTLTCTLSEAQLGDSLYLYDFNGVGFDHVQATATKDGSTFSFKLKKAAPRFYYVGTKDQQVKSVLLGEEENVTLTGRFSSMRRAKLVDGTNKVYTDAMNNSRQLRNEQIGLSREFATAVQQGQNTSEIVTKMAEVDTQKKALLESLELSSPFVAKIIRLYTYYSYQHYNKKRYPNELSYFANEYLAQVDWKDEVYERIPMVYDASNSFVTMLCKTGQFSNDQIEEILDRIIAKVPKKANTHRYLLGGIAGGLNKQNNPLFLDYGARFIEKFGDEQSSSIQNYKKKVELAASFLPGAVAPDFTQNNVEGKAVSLSDYRGKVVLVDFWASWCGPCRKENPHVVHLYEKYKDKGFEVLGVSLDRDRNRWLQAIEKDQLMWEQVSDLKGWKNEVAQLYSISSIPHTILYDEEGRIIARRLRAHQLEAKLKEIFGE